MFVGEGGERGGGREGGLKGKGRGLTSGGRVIEMPKETAIHFSLQISFYKYKLGGRKMGDGGGRRPHLGREGN